jgi:pyruvate,water dikinase
LPLSPAQAGLVELVDGRCAIGIRQRVLGGYLFYSRDSGTLPPAIAAEDAGAFFASLQSEVESRLAGLGAQPDLEDALALFLFAYEPIFGVLQPALRKAHANLREFLEGHAPAGIGLLPALRAAVPSVAKLRNELVARMASSPSQATTARSDYLARFGDEAPTWDVSAATYAEAPDAFAPGERAADHVSLDWQAASAQVEAMISRDERARWRDLLGTARTAVSLGEADDWLYARTQAAVRRALLALGRRLHLAARLREVGDVFLLPLPLVRKAANGESDASTDLAALACEGREAWRRASNHPPPLPDAADGKAVRGFGTGGRAIGRVTWHRGGARESLAATGVLVAKTLLPTELPLISARAVVTETGGPLDHVAAQARERGIPAVVGAQGASSVLREGDLVLVDGDAGLVVRLSPGDRGSRAAGDALL